MMLKQHMYILHYFFSLGYNVSKFFLLQLTHVLQEHVSQYVCNATDICPVLDAYLYKRTFFERFVSQSVFKLTNTRTPFICYGSGNKIS